MERQNVEKFIWESIFAISATSKPIFHYACVGFLGKMICLGTIENDFSPTGLYRLETKNTQLNITSNILEFDKNKFCIGRVTCVACI